MPVKVQCGHPAIAFIFFLHSVDWEKPYERYFCWDLRQLGWVTYLTLAGWKQATTNVTNGLPADKYVAYFYKYAPNRGVRFQKMCHVSNSNIPSPEYVRDYFSTS